jgi:phosphatidate cytidylyltransferase
MSHFHGTLLIAAGVLALLVGLSLLGGWLKLAQAGGPPQGLVEHLNQRLQGWWAMTATIGLALLAGRIGVIVLFAFVSFSALREFLTVAPTRRSDHQAMVMAFFVALPFQYFLVGIEWLGLFEVFIPVYAFLFLPILAAVKSDTLRFMERTGTLHWALMVTVFCISHLPALLNLRIPGFEGRGVFLIVFLVLVVQGGDLAQHLWSRWLGQHPLAPQVSPHKTVEGHAGALITAPLLGMALSWMTPFPIAAAAAIALAATLMGLLGALVLSAMKRDRGVRDWGIAADGGGMLDRIASVCFAAPVYFHIVRLWWSASPGA